MFFNDAHVRIFLMVTALKIVLFHGYHSTDFEVHRNWLAITYSKPISEWYTEATSEWTLDYPPFFAWFEWLLAQVAQHVDHRMLKVSKWDYASWETVVFQRVTVMVSELVLVGAAWYACRRLPLTGDRQVVASLTTFFLLLGSAGLMMVDHIHFQYNGFLLGILLWSALLVEQGHDLLGGLLFAVLLNLKHLFAYVAPLYFLHLLCHYCTGRRALLHLLQLGGGVVAVFAASLGPFVAMGQLPQLLQRLFPFSRGLIHSYWAANAWALYAFTDKLLGALLPRLGQRLELPTAHLAGGKVGMSEFVALPQVSPKVTMGLVVLAMLPCLVATARRPRPAHFVRAVAYANLCGFVFGYHVHEKAILTVLMPLALQVVKDVPRTPRHFFLLSTVGTYALFPLLYQPAEYGFKLFYSLFYTFVVYKALRWLSLARVVHGVTVTSPTPLPGEGPITQKPLLGWLDTAYVLGIVPLEVFNSVVHPLVLKDALPFLPLMLTSVYCAVGVVWVWAEMAAGYLTAAVSAKED